MALAIVNCFTSLVTAQCEITRKDISPPPAQESATGILRSAITDVVGRMQSGGNSGGEVVLAAGDYYLDAVPEDEKYLICIHGTDGLKIRGAGTATRLIVRDNAPNSQGFHRKIFAAYGAKNFVMEDLTIDFAHTARDWVQGFAKDVKISDGTTATFILELDAASPPFRPDAFSPQRCSLLGIVLNEHGQPLEGFPDYFMATDVRPREDGTLEVSTEVAGIDLPAFFDGQRVVIACRKPGEALFCFSNAVHPVLKNLTIHASRGMLIEAYGCDRLELDNVRLKRSEGQLMVSPGDGIHYQGGVSGPYVHDCHFEGLGDDGMNIYAKPFSIEVLGSGQYRVEGDPILLAGDQLWVYTAGHAQHGKFITISESEGDHFKADILPPDFAVNQAVNVSRSGQNFEVINNSFGPLRGLGCRLQTGPGVISGNTFERLSGAPVSLECGLASSENYGHGEGPFPFDITITNNRFSDSGTSHGYNRSGIRRVAPWNPADPHEQAFRNISVKDNTTARMTESNFQKEDQR